LAIRLGDPYSGLSRGLVVWYGLFQAVHALLNGRYLLDPGIPPFEPPPEGWLSQTVAFLDGMAAADFLNALASLLVVAGYFRRARWAGWLGTLTLTVSFYAAVVFTWGAVRSGALRGIGSEYLWVNVPFLPVVVLFFAWSFWVVSGKLNRGASLNRG
jgi:hypothetical protein